MQWDLGLLGLAVLAGLSIGFGVIAVAISWNRTAPWMTGLVATIAGFLGGLFISEGLFGWATQAELQPNYDGLSFDEVLLGFVVGVGVLVIIRLVLGRRVGALAHQ
jgi:formate/nitrite transporter FocA (FNT family)